MQFVACCQLQVAFAAIGDGSSRPWLRGPFPRATAALATPDRSTGRVPYQPGFCAPGFSRIEYSARPTTQAQRNSASQPQPKKVAKASPRFEPVEAIAKRRADHKLVSALFDKYMGARSTSRTKTIMNKICTELGVQTQLEEQTFYPAVKQALKDN